MSDEIWSIALALVSALVGVGIVLTAIGIWQDDKHWKGDQE